MLKTRSARSGAGGIRALRFTLRSAVLSIAVAAVAALGPGCASGGSSGTSANPEDARLERLFDRYLDFLFRTSPTTATSLGFHELDAELDDLSREALERRATELAGFVSRLGTDLDRSRLSADGRADHDIFRNEVEGSLFSLRELRPYQKDPLVYSDVISGAVYEILKREHAPLDERVRNAIARMRRLPRLLDQAKANLAAPPAPHVDVAIRRNAGAIDFYEKDLVPFVKGSSLEDRALAEGKKAAAALREYQRWLENDLRPRATGDWKLGRKLWEMKLRHSLDSSLYAAEIRRKALGEFNWVRQEMYRVAKELWPTYFAGRPLPTGENALQETTRAIVDRIADERATRETIVADARRAVEELRAFIREKDLLALPEPDRCRIIVMPEFRAGVSTAYLDPAPPLDPDGQSFYAIEPIPRDWPEEKVESRLREYNDHMLKVLSIHEGYPGHYVQLEYSNRHPSKIRRVLGNGPMIEGWAVYSELMMAEAGFAGFDPRFRLSRMKFYLRAVINALIDQGLHFGEMDDAAALALMIDGGFQERNEAEGKLIRAKVTSTQLSTYFVGFQEVYSLREEVKAREGERFSLKGFHERFLSQGSPPVRVIRAALLGEE